MRSQRHRFHRYETIIKDSCSRFGREEVAYLTAITAWHACHTLYTLSFITFIFSFVNECLSQSREGRDWLL